MSDLKFGYSLHLSEHVERLLADGTLDEIFKLVEGEIDDQWKSTPPSDTATREQLYHEVHALNRVRIKMASIVDSVRFSSME